MSRIVTGPDGIRYRPGDIAPLPERGWEMQNVGRAGREGLYSCSWLKCYGIVVDGVLHKAVPLPTVPDWPLPGPAPQYIASTWDNPDVKFKQGDWFLYFFMDDSPTGHHLMLMQVGGLETSGLPGTKMGEHSFRGFIAARADPEADA